MKALIALVMLLLSTPAWAGDVWRPCLEPCIEFERSLTTGTSKYIVPILRKEDVTVGMIRKWAASGEICRALDRHFWIMIPHTTLEYRPDGAYPKHRKCELCGKTETKEEVWK